MSKIRRKLLEFKKKQEQIACVTCYDASFSKILDELNIDIVLVGDSLGMVIMGDHNTHNVTLNESIYHTSCVAKNKNNFILMSDMPKDSYEDSAIAIKNATKLLDCDADIVKIEFKKDHIDVVKKLISKEIPVCCHLGYLPQYALSKEDVKVYGKSSNEYNSILEQAILLDNLGVDLILLECVDEKLSKLISDTLKVPVIGIGSGKFCDGQVQVLYDIIGISSNPPKFSKNYLTGSLSIKDAIKEFYNYVKNIKN